MSKGRLNVRYRGPDVPVFRQVQEKIQRVMNAFASTPPGGEGVEGVRASLEAKLTLWLKGYERWELVFQPTQVDLLFGPVSGEVRVWHGGRRAVVEFQISW